MEMLFSMTGLNISTGTMITNVTNAGTIRIRSKYVEGGMISADGFKIAFSGGNVEISLFLTNGEVITVSKECNDWIDIVIVKRSVINGYEYDVWIDGNEELSRYNDSDWKGGDKIVFSNVIVDRIMVYNVPLSIVDIANLFKNQVIWDGLVNWIEFEDWNGSSCNDVITKNAIFTATATTVKGMDFEKNSTVVLVKRW